MTDQKQKDNVISILECDEFKSFARGIFEDTTNCIITTDTEGVIQFYNPGAECMLHYAKANVIKKTSIIEFIDALEIMKRAKCLSKELNHNIETGFSVFTAKADRGMVDESVWTYIRENGDRFPVITSISALHSVEGKITGYLFISKDVSQQYKAEDQVVELSKKMSVVIDNMIDCIITTDSKGWIESFNKAAEKTFGFKSSEIIGKPIEILLPLSHVSNHKQYVQKYKETGESTIIGSGRESIAKHKDGREFPIDIGVTETWIGENRYFTALLRDITERKRHEKELVAAKDSAEQSSVAKSDFLSRMSHEFRTPLNAILGFAQILQLNADQINEDQLDSIREIQQAGKHLLELINQVLDISQIEHGKLELVLNKVNFIEVLNESLSLIEPLANNKGIRYVNAISESDNYFIDADKTRLKQVLINLLSNAVKYNSKNGTITLSAEKPSETLLRVSVADTGPGISKEKQKLLFKPFERLGEPGDYVEGAGIGLALSKSLIETMNGRIGIDSDVGKGSCFWFELNLVK